MFISKLITAFTISLLMSVAALATDGKNELILQFSQEYGVHYSHTMAPKETIYSISKQAGVSVDQIYQINNLRKTDIISIGQNIIVPVNHESISSTKTAGSGLKVMYQVKKKDNLFQIAKRYFNQEVNAVVSRNNLANMTLSPGQLLHIGWMKPNQYAKKTAPTAYRSTPASAPAKPAVTQTTTTVTQTEVNHKPQEPTQSSEPNKYRVVQHTKLPTASNTTPNTSTVTQENATAPTTTSSYSTGPQTSAEVVSEVVSHTAPPSSATQTTPVNKVIVNQSTTAAPVQSTTTNTTEYAPAATTSTTTSIPAKSTPPGTMVIRSEKASPELSFLTDPNLLSDKGMAIWDREDNEPLNLYVLHQSAKVNSYMKIINPMIGRVVIAKVIGRLPDNVYGTDVKMVVSTAVAKSLGVMDARFLTEMKFIK